MDHGEHVAKEYKYTQHKYSTPKKAGAASKLQAERRETSGHSLQTLEWCGAGAEGLNLELDWRGRGRRRSGALLLRGGRLWRQLALGFFVPGVAPQASGDKNGALCRGQQKRSH